MARRFFIIRHGESESNAGLVTQSAGSVNLTEKGKREAQAAADAFNVTPDLIVTSSYIRTQQTAEPFLQKFKGTPQEEWNIREFTYLSEVHYTGRTNDQRRAALEEYWDRADPHMHEGGTGESFVEFITRLRDFIDKMKNDEAGVTLAFSHGYMMSGLLFLLEGRDKGKIDGDTMRDFWKFHRSQHAQNTEILEFSVDNGNITLLQRIPPQPVNDNAAPPSKPVAKPRGPSIMD